MSAGEVFIVANEIKESYSGINFSVLLNTVEHEIDVRYAIIH